MMKKRRTYTWDEANKMVELLNVKNYKGHEDWRLPTVEELLSIVDYTRYNPATTIPDTVTSNYWSSTSCVYLTSYAWGMHFYYGYVTSSDKTLCNYVRAVRGQGKLEWSKTL